MTRVLFFAYPLYADFEIAHTLFFLRKIGKATITTATIDGNPVESLGGIVTQAHVDIAEVIPDNYDLILISGGDGISEVLNNRKIHSVLKQFNSLGKPITAICASAALLGKSGLLKGNSFTCNPNTYDVYQEVFTGASYTGKRIEIAGNIVTAKGTAFPEFTQAVLDQLRLWESVEQRDWAYKFCRGDI
jgi:putative intracellular protease/amidase